MEPFVIVGYDDDGQEWELLITPRMKDGHLRKPDIHAKTANDLLGCNRHDKGVYMLPYDPTSGRENVFIRSDHPSAP